MRGNHASHDATPSVNLLVSCHVCNHRQPKEYTPSVNLDLFVTIVGLTPVAVYFSTTRIASAFVIWLVPG